MRRITVAAALALLARPAALSSPPPPSALVDGARSPVAAAPAVPPAPAFGAAVDRPRTEAAASADPYFEDQLLVAPPDGRTLPALAAQLGATVMRPVGRSGFGVLKFPDPTRAAASLRDAGAELAPVARIVGAGWLDGWRSRLKATPTTSETTSTGTATQPPDPWWLQSVSVEQAPDLAGIVVAVLDTGVAYEDHAGFVQAEGLAGVSFVAPADFVELDGHPNDDHQHGTHIASLIASEGRFPGSAPGVSIMPVKVLDHQNAGTEWALIEGLHHAVDHHADVINLSLSFPLGYVPSAPLRDALTRAHEAGVVMVAAAGNDSARELSWPAASRLVLAVGAATSAEASLFTREHAEYSNVSPGVDILAPGGSLDLDSNQDGHLDGLLAETIDPTDPSRLGFWFYEGTSQAAALTSGAVAHLLEAGVAPRNVAATLQQSQGGFSSLDAVWEGSGADELDLAAALASPVASADTYVGIVPYLRKGQYLTYPAAQVTAVDDAGEPLASADVVATVTSATDTYWTMCVTDTSGTCTLLGWPEDGNTDAWAFHVDAVVQEGVASRPSRAIFASEAGEVLLQAVHDAQDDDNADYVVAVYWEDSYDSVLGETTAEAWAVVNAGTGLLSSPMGLLFRPRHLNTLAQPGTVSLDVDGTGLLSSPMGFRFSVRTLDVYGVGLLSSPMGLGDFDGGLRLRLIGLSGSGLLSSPMGFHPSDLFARMPSRTFGTGLLSSPMGFAGRAVLLDYGFAQGISMRGTAFGDALEPGGGLVGASGEAPTSTMVASGVVDVGLAMATTTATGLSLRSGVEWCGPVSD